MGVSATGQKRPHSESVRAAVVALSILGCALFFLFGPPLVPGMNQAAKDECNRLSGGNSRTYRLTWHTSSYNTLQWPHWECSNTLTPKKAPQDLGWWVAL